MTELGRPRHKAARLGVAVALAFTVAGCSSAPKVQGFRPAKGPAQTLVRVAGQNLFAAQVVWDVGLPTETVLPSGFIGARWFSVPHAATVGDHPVRIQSAGGSSAVKSFTVSGATSLGPPRIDRISLASASFAAGKVTSVLYVQGPSIDVGATVLLDDAGVATFTHKGIFNRLYGIDPNHLGYPIPHYLALAAAPAALPAGAQITVQVRNLDMTLSDPVEFELPQSEAVMDRDGDKLLDSWELSGYDADGDGVVDVPLPSLGADPDRADIFLELDIMDKKGGGGPLAHAPETGVGKGLWGLTSSFGRAPLLNPYESKGVRLHLTTGAVPFTCYVVFGVSLNEALQLITDPSQAAEVAGCFTLYATLKATHFDSDAGKPANFTHHYAVWSDREALGRSGWSDGGACLGVQGPGDDFLIGLGSLGVSFHGVRSQSEILLHEMGHDLAQRHSGTGDEEYRPSYLSVMSYSWVLRTGQGKAWRIQHPTCFPRYYAEAGFAEAGGAKPVALNNIISYSEGMAPALDEAGLDEILGVCGQPIDFDGGGFMGADLNGNGAKNDVLEDFANWRALDFSGPTHGGCFQP